MCVCVCARARAYPACKEHAPHYVVVCGVSGPAEFFHILCHNFREEKNFKHKMSVLIFSINSSENILFLRRNQPDNIINVLFSLLYRARIKIQK